LTLDHGLNLNDPGDVKRKAGKPFKIRKLAFFVFFKRQ
jgi:hypothetical protein